MYIGSAYGFNYNDFISKCKGIGPTVCRVTTAKGRVFGAYTPIAWNNDGKDIATSGESFVYKVNEDR